MLWSIHVLDHHFRLLCGTNILRHPFVLIFMAIKMKFHTVKVHIFFSTNPQQPLFVGWGWNPNSDRTYIRLPSSHVWQLRQELGGGGVDIYGTLCIVENVKIINFNGDGRAIPSEFIVPTYVFICSNTIVNI